MAYTEYILLEYKLGCLPKILYKSRFSQDVEIMKMRYEANNYSDSQYKIDKYTVIL